MDDLGMPDDSRKIPKARIKQVDKLYWDPSERAQGILAILETVRERLRKENEQKHKPEGTDVPSQWDILCFSIEHVAAMSVALDDDELTVIARKLVSWLYSTHYTAPGKIYGAPDRPRGEKKSEEDPSWDGSVTDEQQHEGFHRDEPESNRSESRDPLRSDPRQGGGTEEGGGSG